MTDRKYLPTFSELIDRLCIVQLKMIFLDKHKREYEHERDLIMHDIDLLLLQQPVRFAMEVHAIAMLMLTNRFIWENEGKARMGGSEQDKLLKLTHSVNGVRNTAKNVLGSFHGERKDYKVDCLAADLPKEFGNWDVFNDQV